MHTYVPLYFKMAVIEDMYRYLTKPWGLGMASKIRQNFISKHESKEAEGNSRNNGLKGVTRNKYIALYRDA